MTSKLCFGPVVNDATRVLILGSLPGEASLKAGQYYAHPRNQFWRLLEDSLQVPLITQEYDIKLSILREHGIGLWDVVARAVRQGSLDTALSDIQHNNLKEFLSQLHQVQLVVFNGCAAWNAARQLQHVSIATQLLPSSSPAHTLSYQVKLEQWRKAIVRCLSR